MSLKTTTRCREYREGRTSRRRTYNCRECEVKFQVDTIDPLPLIDRVCNDCRGITALYSFIDPVTQKEYQVRAVNAELATLRAWAINPGLKFKVE